ncbi:MAG: RecX family transcriptional regulator [Ignavibacteriaceae bacterium]|nr:RecX family transcriptional regulator [Ignavibacteriaceae bacterium]
MILNKIILTAGSGAKLFFDEGLTLRIPQYKLIEYSLSEGVEVAVEKLNALMKESNLFSLESRALYWMQFKRFSEKELRKKMIKYIDDEKSVSEVVDKFISLGYLNDLKLAEDYVSDSVKFKKDGVRKIRVNLFKKGISKETINEVLSTLVDEDELIEKGVELALKKQKTFTGKNLDSRSITQKLFSFLAGKGYTTSQIKKVLSVTGDKNAEEIEEC